MRLFDWDRDQQNRKLPHASSTRGGEECLYWHATLSWPQCCIIQPRINTVTDRWTALDKSSPFLPQCECSIKMPINTTMAPHCTEHRLDLALSAVRCYSAEQKITFSSEPLFCPAAPVASSSSRWCHSVRDAARGRFTAAQRWREVAENLCHIRRRSFKTNTDPIRRWNDASELLLANLLLGVRINSLISVMGLVGRCKRG